MATTTHHCPCGCGTQIARNRLACKEGWYRLPFDLRKEIQTHYRRNPGAHLAAVQDAIEWYAANPAPGSVTA